ncbi:hypothetical protein [uncultured Propionibacterium sp.]|uniref:hypothetical protein n=1 Tax=uncultured Propionibacterium sp. TaxID=218066 RepID=UPI00292EE53B|nr:hypothetical protein [uncultured Propionibacterium sp.]
MPVGRALCDTDNRDGPLADQFRSETWPSANAVKQMVEQGNELQHKTMQAFSAGGT